MQFDKHCYVKNIFWCCHKKKLLSHCKLLFDFVSCGIDCMTIRKRQIHTLNILLAFFDTKDGTPPIVLILGPWNFQHSPAMVWGCTAREDFWVSPPQPAPGSKRCLQRWSGGPSAYFRASFAKYKMLGMVKEGIDFLQAFQSDPHSQLQAQKGCLQRRSGGPSAYFRASFAKYQLFGIV